MAAAGSSAAEPVDDARRFGGRGAAAAGAAASARGRFAAPGALVHFCGGRFAASAPSATQHAHANAAAFSEPGSQAAQKLSLQQTRAQTRAPPAAAAPASAAPAQGRAPAPSQRAQRAPPPR